MSLESETGYLQTKSTKFEWHVKRFYGYCAIRGRLYDSPKYTVQYMNHIITNWRLQLHPKGHDQDQKDLVSIELYLHENKIDLAVDGDVTVMASGKYPLGKYKVGEMRFKARSRGWGRTLILLSTLRLPPGVLIEDVVTVTLELTFHPPHPVDEKIALAYNQWIDDIAKGFGDFEQLLESGSFADVTFTIRDKKIKSHKAILSCRSPVFKAMLEDQMKENEPNTIDVSDIDYDVMMELLRFLYSGNVKNIESIASDLLFAADRYRLIELKALCENTLYDELTEDNAVRYLHMIELCDTLHLKRLVIDFTAAHYKVIIKKSGFEDLSNKIMFLILVAIANLDKSAPK